MIKSGKNLFTHYKILNNKEPHLGSPVLKWIDHLNF